MIVRKGVAYDEGSFIAINTRKIKEMIDIIESSLSDKEKAYKLREICVSYKMLLKEYFHKGKVKSSYEDYREYLFDLRDLFLKYEENGLLEEAKIEKSFILEKDGNLDSRYLVNAYINDYYSYDLDEFYKRYKINRTIFNRAVLRVQNNDKDLYEQYLVTFNNNKTKRLVLPIYNINSIIEGIKTGKTYDGKNFDIFEFYKITPFKNKDIDLEMRTLEKDFPKLSKLRQYKVDFCRENNKRALNYADYMYLFTKCFNEKDAELLKTWMDDNNVKSITPIYRASTVNFYYNTPEDAEYTMEDAEAVFDIMEENEYPKIKEIYDILKAKRISKKKSLVIDL